MGFLGIAEGVEGLFKGVVKPVLDKFVTDAKDRLEAETMFFKAAHEINMAQIEINKTEAASSNFFVAGWRPAVGWVCVASFAYAVILNDFLNWGAAVLAIWTGTHLPPFPEPDTTITMELLLALLGLGVMRSYEKTKK